MLLENITEIIKNSNDVNDMTLYLRSINKVFIRNCINNGLIISIDQNNIDYIRYFLNSGADINYNNGTPLITASKNLNREIVKFLLERGADLDICNYYALSIVYIIDIDNNIIDIMLEYIKCIDILIFIHLTENAIIKNNIKRFNKLLSYINLFNESEKSILIEKLKDNIYFIEYLNIIGFQFINENDINNNITNIYLEYLLCYAISNCTKDIFINIDIIKSIINITHINDIHIFCSIVNINLFIFLLYEKSNLLSTTNCINTYYKLDDNRINEIIKYNLEELDSNERLYIYKLCILKHEFNIFERIINIINECNEIYNTLYDYISIINTDTSYYLFKNILFFKINN